MHPTDFCYYIDTKGKAHEAQAVTVRENKVLKATDGFENLDKVINNEPIISLSYVNPATGRTETVPELVHMSHPSKQETNPAMPTIHLHCWKRTDEGHTEPAEDHPIFDHPHEQTKVDGFGKPIPKARPKHEAHIAAHQASLPKEQVVEIHEAEKAQAKLGHQQRTSLPAFRLPQDQGKPARVMTTSIASPALHEVLLKAGQVAQVSGPPVGHPANSETVHFDFDCQSCGEPVKRVAHHQGGTMWDKIDAGVDALFGWVKHECDPATARAFSHKLNPPKEQPSAVAEAVATEEEKPVEVEKKLPVLFVLYTSPDITTYQGMKLVLPDGYEHIVKRNGFSQDSTDAIRFAHVQGHPQVTEDQSVINFREDMDAAAATAAAAAVAEEQHELDVIAELEAAPPAPKEPEIQKSDDPA